MERLDEIKRAMRLKGRLLVLLSGGLDSTLLAWLAREALGNGARALTFLSPIMPAQDAMEARVIAELIGIPCEVVSIDELESDLPFSANPPERCFLCRKIRDREARRHASLQGIDVIADGLNASDLASCHAGIAASIEDGVWQPFVEFRLTKEEIRECARRIGLPTWDKPATACLCTRFPFGVEMTRERIRRVEDAELLMGRLGFAVCRVRHFPLETAVVEIDDLDRALACRDAVVPGLRDMGFLFVTLDLEGFASGAAPKGSSPGGS